MLTRRARARRGFTLAEVIVAFTLIAVLAAVIIPTVAGRLQDGYENSIVSEFENLSTAVMAYRQDVGKYPPKLSYLSALPSGAVDHCSVPLSATAIANWRGPYVSRFISPTIGAGVAYTFANKDTVSDTLIKTSGPNGFIIQMIGPDSRTAINVDEKIDGSNNNGAGVLQWVGTARTDVILEFIVPSAAGAC